jgi:uncharacterized protein (DUF1778 family)
MQTTKNLCPHKASPSAGIKHNKGARRRTIGVQVDAEQYRQITEAAKRRGVSRSRFIVERMFSL